MDLIIGTLLIFGDGVAYGHQFFMIVRDQSTEGLSSTTVSLNFVSSVLVLVNFVMLDLYEFYTSAFFEGFTLLGFEKIIAFLQILMSVVYTGLFFLVFLVCNTTNNRMIGLVWAFIILGLTICFYFTVLVNSAFTLFADVVGVAAAIVTVVTWIPQIYKLIRTRNSSELSLILVLTHVFGALIAIIFQAVLNHESWSTWVSTVVLMVEHSFLLLLMIVFHPNIPWHKCKKNVEPKKS